MQQNKYSDSKNIGNIEMSRLEEVIKLTEEDRRRWKSEGRTVEKKKQIFGHKTNKITLEIKFISEAN